MTIVIGKTKTRTKIGVMRIQMKTGVTRAMNCDANSSKLMTDVTFHYFMNKNGFHRSNLLEYSLNT